VIIVASIFRVIIERQKSFLAQDFRRFQIASARGKDWPNTPTRISASQYLLEHDFFEGQNARLDFTGNIALQKSFPCLGFRGSGAN
jgi:hypothetical protein